MNRGRRTSLLQHKEARILPKPAAAKNNKNNTKYNLNVYQLLKMKEGNASVLVIRSLGGIGDVLMCTPLLRQIKKDFPNCDLTFAINRDKDSSDVYYQLIQNCPFINHITDARTTDKKKYDTWIDITSVCIQYENKKLPAMNRIDIFARAAGFFKLDDALPFYQTTPAERDIANGILSKANSRVLAIHSASFDGKRSWSPDRIHNLIRLLASERPDITVLLFDFNGAVHNKKQFTNVIDCSGEPIRIKAALIQRSNLFFGPDSGLMHIAGALRIRSLVLFGPIPAAARINYYPSHSAITAPEKHSQCPCWYDKCRINHVCMTGISPSAVLHRINEIL